MKSMFIQINMIDFYKYSQRYYIMINELSEGNVSMT